MLVARGLRRRLRSALLLGLAAGLLAAAAPPHAQPAYQHLVGALHEHSGYSDGYPGSTPGHYYASARGFGLDFLGAGEHSDSLDIPFVFSEECLGPGIVQCPFGDEPERALRKWDAMQAYAQEATDERFVGFRGFEWTSDRFGHINVYYSRNFANAKADGGYATMETFWRWFATGPDLGGGSDGLATFNHPGAKRLDNADPAFNWNDFAYVPEADERMVGIEVYNDDDEFGSRGPDGGYYVHALDRGWHVGAIGAEDLGHIRGDDWGGPTWAKTVVLAQERTAQAIHDALLARRFYAVRFPGIRLEFSVDGQPMGARLGQDTGDRLKVRARSNRDDLRLELVTTGAQVVASAAAGEALQPNLPWDPGHPWFFVRAVAPSGAVLAYSSPVWVTANG
ncbi:MAG TPA: hypothetical protein VGA36_01490 [Nitriliruptorales bacterium]